MDEKPCYHFGRNPTLNDFCTDHSSCSRIHSALVYHKHLNRFFLVDLGSTHGTFIGSTRLEAHKPTQLTPGLTFHFGASTREYTLREKPKSVGSSSNLEGNSVNSGDSDVPIESSDLPEDQIELDHLTEFNTANNKRISVLGISNIDLPKLPSKKRKLKSVTFKEEEDIINPEDIDPTVGKFRNLVQSAVIPSAKKAKLSLDPFSYSYSGQTSSSQATFHITRPDHSNASNSDDAFNPLISKSVSLRLGIHLPNPTPSVTNDHDDVASSSNNTDGYSSDNSGHESEGDEKKKKYIKESWPGRNPGSV